MPLTDAAARNAKPAVRTVRMFDRDGLYLGPGLFFGVLLAVVDIAEMRRLTVVTVAVAVRRPNALFDSKRLGRGQTSGAQRRKETPEYRGNDRPCEPEHPQVR